MALPICIPFVLIFMAVYLTYLYLTWHFDTWKKLGIQGPKPKLIFGNFPSGITQKQHIIYDYDEVYCKYKKTNNIVGVFTTRNPELFVLDPKLAHQILVTHFSKFRDNLSSKWILNRKADTIARRNPFFTTGDEWKSQRADALGGITANKLSSAYPIWKSTAQKMRKFMEQKIEENNGSVVLNARDLAYRFTVDVMADFLWGVESDTFTQMHGANNKFMEMVAKMLKTSLQTVSYYIPLGLVPVLKNFCKPRFFPFETDKFFSDLTKDAMAIRLKAGKSDRVDYLNYIMQLQDKKRLTHDDTVGHIMTAMLDGYETSGTLISNTLYYLAKYPAVQEKLRAEILENIEADGFMSFETLNNLAYLDQCVNETLRIITPIPIFGRLCTEATSLEVEPDRIIEIPKDMVVTIPIFSFHHDPDYFPSPYKYIPDRFDNGSHNELTKQGIFMPFGTGPRVCLGMRMGMFEIKTALVELLHKYRVECTPTTVEEKKPDSGTFILGVDGDMSLEFERI